MVSTNLNPGRKVLKVKPAENCIIMVQCSASRKDILLPLTLLTHCLPAQPEGRRQKGEGLAEEQWEVYTVSNHLSLPHLLFKSFCLSVHSQPKRRGRHACKETTAFLSASCIYKRRHVGIKGITT